MGVPGIREKKTNEGWQGKKETYGCRGKGMLHFMRKIDKSLAGLPGFEKRILSGGGWAALQGMLSGNLHTVP